MKIMEQNQSNFSNEGKIEFFKTRMNEAVEKNDADALRIIIDKIIENVSFDGDGSNRRNKIFADATIIARKKYNMEMANVILKEMKDNISGNLSYKDFISCCKNIVDFEVEKNDVNSLKTTLKIVNDKDGDKYGFISYFLSKDHLRVAAEQGNTEIMGGFLEGISEKFDSVLLPLILNISCKNGQQGIVEIVLNKCEDRLSITDLGIAAKNAILSRNNDSNNLIQKALDKKINTLAYKVDYINASADNRFDPDEAITMVNKLLLEKLSAVKNKFISSKSISPEINVAKKYLENIENYIKNRARYHQKKLMISLFDKNAKVVDEGKTTSYFKAIQSQIDFVLKLESNIRKFEIMEDEIASKLNKIKLLIENSGMWSRRKVYLKNNVKSVQEETNLLNFYDKNIIYNALISKDTIAKVDNDFKMKKPKVYDIVSKINNLKECEKKLDREKNSKASENDKNNKIRKESILLRSHMR